MKKETSIIPCCNPKIRLLPGLYRDPAGELTTLPRLPSRGLPSPDPSHSTPSAPRLPRGAEGAYVISYEDSGLPPLFHPRTAADLTVYEPSHYVYLKRMSHYI